MRAFFLVAPLLLSSVCLAQTPADAPTDSPVPAHQHSADEHQNAAPFGGTENKPDATIDYLWRKSDEAFHAGDYPRAIGLHRAIVALDPADTESFGVAAWLLWSSEKGTEAIAHIQRGLDANPQNWEMWEEAGQHFDLQKKLPEAKNAYANAVKFVPKEENTSMLRRRLAHSAEKSGDIKLSLETWRALAKDFPEDAVIKNNLARVEKLPLSQILHGRQRTQIGALIYDNDLTPVNPIAPTKSVDSKTHISIGPTF
ncbi:MAG TPA: tetratricopeptide repeat protein [Abditibacteriaceae bacterium]|jgi:tetratricopeptide (TPR) repeat protein